MFRDLSGRLHAEEEAFLRGCLGAGHKTLASFSGAFAAAGLSIRVVREFSAAGHVVLPWDIGVVAERSR